MSRTDEAGKDALWILEQVLELPDNEREPFLDRCCGRSTSLRRDVASLIAADADAERLQASHWLNGNEADQSRCDAGLREGDRLGPYRLLQRIGRGGASSVYLAARADDTFRKRVAIKIARPGLHGELALLRFQTERQILASLDHPAIARLLDGGTTRDGIPFIVMEYVDGRPIDEHCNSHGLSIEERLRLICEVCSAVEYAHQNLVVHRDLKPGNILVSASGSPKLLDFGIAKLLNPDLLAGRIDRTATWMRVMTPQYASPEQVRGEPITTASDVYSLGVVLYQLLTGRLPHHLEGCSVAQAERLLTETEPLRPSLCVASCNRPLRPGAGGHPEATGTTEPPSIPQCGLSDELLRRRLDGDLDTIVLKALRAEPGRRYASVEQMSEDLRRHLDGLPVRARKATVGYRISKLMRRHRLVAAAGLLALALIVGFGIAMGLQSIRLARECDEARRERDKNEQIVAFIESIFESADPSIRQGQPLTPEEMLDRGASRVSELENQPLVQAALMGTLGNIYSNLGVLDRAESMLRDSLGIRRSLLDAEHKEVLESLHDLSLVLIKRARYDQAETLLRQVLAAERGASGSDRVHHAGLLNDLAVVARRKGDLEEARQLQLRALELLDGQMHPYRATSLSNLGTVLADLGDYDGAEQAYRQALAIRRQLLGDAHPEIAQTLNNLAALHHAMGDYAEAARRCREALVVQRVVLGEQHPEVATSLHNLGAILHQQGELSQAEKVFREALELTRRVDGEHHPNVASTLANLASVLTEEGVLGEAEDLGRQAVELSLNALGTDHPLVASSLAGLGECLREQWLAAGGAPSAVIAEAERCHRRALAIRINALGPDHPRAARSMVKLAGILIDRGTIEETEPMLSRALEIQQSTLGRSHPDEVEARLCLGRVLLSRGELEAAERLLRAAVEASRERVTPPWKVAEAESLLGECLTRRGRTDEARDLLEHSTRLLLEHHGPLDLRAQIAVRRRIQLFRVLETPDPEEQHDPPASPESEALP